MAHRRSYCEQCGRPDSEVGRISRRGLCSECGEANYLANAAQLRAKSGPAYNLWRKRTLEGLAARSERLDAEWAQREQRAS